MYGIFSYILLFIMVRYGKCRKLYQRKGCYGYGKTMSNLPTASHDQNWANTKLPDRSAGLKTILTFFGDGLPKANQLSGWFLGKVNPKP